MRAFLKSIGLFLAIQATIAAAIYWSYQRQYPGRQHALAATIDKHRLLRNQTPPRLIFVGGSSLAFGIKSSPIAEACQRHPVNMGLNAGLGLRFMFRETAPYLQPGDWIILAPEYQLFESLSGTSDILIQMAEIEPANAALLDGRQWAEILDRGALLRFGRITRAVLRNPTNMLRKRPISASMVAYYRRDAFNSVGDCVAHLSVRPVRMTETTFQYIYHEDKVNATVAEINRFANLAKARGAKVFLSHPPLPDGVFASNRPQIDLLEANLRRNLTIPILDDPDDMVFPIDHFFDTYYHLAAVGVEKRTKLLAEAMARQVGSP